MSDMSSPEVRARLRTDLGEWYVPAGTVKAPLASLKELMGLLDYIDKLESQLKTQRVEYFNEERMAQALAECDRLKAALHEERR